MTNTPIATEKTEEELVAIITAEIDRLFAEYPHPYTIIGDPDEWEGVKSVLYQIQEDEGEFSAEFVAAFNSSPVLRAAALEGGVDLGYRTNDQHAPFTAIVEYAFVGDKDPRP